MKTAGDSTQAEFQQQHEETDADRVAHRVALLLENHTELKLVVERWESLPAAIRTGILAMIDAASTDHIAQENY